MKVVLDNNFGSRRPDAKAYLPDLVEINENIRVVEHEDGDYYLADSTYYTYQEYAAYQDGLIAAQKALNEEQDELIAELIEGE